MTKAVSSMLRRLIFCCMKPKNDTNQGEDIEFSRISKSQAKKSRTNDTPNERLAGKESTLPSIVPASPTRPKAEPIASTSYKNAAYTQHGGVHPVFMSESLATSSNPRSSPDEISVYAGSAPMYRNVKNAAEDRRALLQRLRTPEQGQTQLPDTTSTLMNGKRPAEEEISGSANRTPNIQIQEGELGEIREGG